MPIEISLEWQEHLNALRDFTGTVMVLGAPDAGKTSFTTALVNHWAEVGKRGAVLDCDLGQSEIGPPGTIGLAYVEEPTPSLSDLPHPLIEFVGVISPPRNPALALCAAKMLYDRASADAVVIDTCGHVFGFGAILYKHTKARLLRPNLVLALQKTNELEPMLTALGTLGIDMRRVPASIAAIRRPPGERTKRRQWQWARYFENATEYVIPFEQVAIVGCRWRSGRQLESKEFQAANSLCGGHLLWADRTADTLHIVAGVRSDTFDRAPLMERFGVRSVTLTPPRAFRHLLVGALDEHGHTMAEGIITDMDYARQDITLLTPLHSASSIRCLLFGLHRVRTDGRDLGPIRPGLV